MSGFVDLELEDHEIGLLIESGADYIEWLIRDYGPKTRTAEIQAALLTARHLKKLGKKFGSLSGSELVG